MSSFKSGFHFTTHQGHVGPGVPIGGIDDYAQPLPRKERDAWKYHEALPSRGVKLDRYFYSYEELIQLSYPAWTHADIKRWARIYRWRWRLDNTTKLRQFYLWDIVATKWAYMQDWESNKIQHDLLADAQLWTGGKV